MTFEDPFFTVKEEVLKALSKTLSLYRRWNDLQSEPITASLLKEEIEWTTTELKNSLRSIEWDLEDLDDTISIVEKNSNKFKIDSNELIRRRRFIEDTRAEIKLMREKLSFLKTSDADKTSRQLISDHFVTVKMAGGISHNSTKYSKLENQFDSPERNQFVRNVEIQNRMVDDQDDQLKLISGSLGTLKHMSRQIGIELDEQDEMLNELNLEIEQTDTRIDSTMKKVAKILHLSNDRSQWIAIIILSGLFILILLLFIVL